MKIVCFSVWGEGSGLAYRLKRDGCDVLFAMLDDIRDTLTEKERPGKFEDPEEKKRRLSTLDGLVEKMDANKAVAMLKKVPKEQRKDYFIFADMNALWKVTEELKDLGFNGIFPTEEDREMESDRERAKEFVEKNYPDLKIMEVEEFTDVKSAIDFLKDTDELWCIKGNDSDAETWVPDTDNAKQEAKNASFQLEKSSKDYEKAGFILERKIKNVIELTPEVTFWNGKPIYALMDIELKRKNAGNTGKMVGTAADLVFPVPLESEIIQMILPQAIKDEAKKHKGMFVIDASLLFDPETGDAYYGEYCYNRKGWNSFYTELAMLDKPSDYFEAVVKGINPYDTPEGKCAVSVRLFNDKHDKEGKPMENLPLFYDEYTANDLWFMDVKGTKDREGEGREVTSGYAKDLAVVTGYGDTIRDAARRCYMYVEGNGDDIDGVTFMQKNYRPMHDVLSEAYSGNIISRYKYGVEQGLFEDAGLISLDNVASVDFDGVVADKDENPIDGAFDALKTLKSEGFTVIIYTARTSLKEVEDWLTDNMGEDWRETISEVTNQKVASEWYVDDRCLEFKSWKSVLERIL